MQRLLSNNNISNCILYVENYAGLVNNIQYHKRIKEMIRRIDSKNALDTSA